jgi:hypothetical protein
MHSRQASVLSQAQRVLARLEGRIVKEAAAPILWKYEDTTGDAPKSFYLEEKRTTVRSPFTGKSFTARPKRHNLAQVGQEMKEEAKEDAGKTASFANPFEE